MEEVLCELAGEDINEQGLPPGFRFHPTDEELITFYLASKVFNGSFCGVDIAVVDLNRCEPWELPGMLARFHLMVKSWYLCILFAPYVSGLTQESFLLFSFLIRRRHSSILDLRIHFPSFWVWNG